LRSRAGASPGAVSPSKATEEEIRASSIQFVRKLSGFTRPSRANEAAFEIAIDQVAAAARVLIASLVTNAEPKDREEEAGRARARNAARFGARGPVSASPASRRRR
jgi:hypothetical protein